MLRIFSFSLQAWMHSQISLCRFCGNSVSKLHHGKSGEMNSNITRNFLRKLLSIFFSGDIAFVTLAFNAIQNIPSKINQKQCYKTDPRKEPCNSVRWINTAWSSFWEIFHLVFILCYCVCHQNVQCALKYPIADSKKTVLENCSRKRTV